MFNHASAGVRPPSVPPEPTSSPAERMVCVRVEWGQGNPLHSQVLPRGSTFWVGGWAPGSGREGARTVHFAVQLPVGQAPVPIARATAHGVCVCLPAGARGWIAFAGGRSASFDQLPTSPEPIVDAQGEPWEACALPDDAEARIEFEGLSFLVSSSERPRTLEERRSLRALLFDQRWVLGSMAVHLGMLALFALLPPRSAAISLDLDSSERRFAQYLLTPPSLDPIRLAGAEQLDGAPGESDPLPAPTPADARTTAPARPKRTQRQPTTTSAPQATLTRDAQRALAAGAGIIGVLRTGAPSLGPIFAGPEGFNGDGSGTDLAFLFGHGAGIALHAGLTPGGAMRAGGTVAVGKLGTGSGGGPGLSGALGALHGRTPVVPKISVDPAAKVFGSLPKEAIRRVIQRHLSEVRHCYDQGLLGRPDLQGRVSMQFIIATSGEVRTAQGAGSDPALRGVVSCIESAVRRWQFPAPSGGGVVSVNYPFVLQLTGG